MTLIGLYGDSRSGKDTVASILVKELGFEQRNMADPIREVLLKIDPYVADIEPRRLSRVVKDIGWDETKKYFSESVDYMIALGQAMRDIAPRIWLDACLVNPYDRLVIADVRQPNEYNEIIRRGGVVWNVKRPGTVPRGMDRLLEDKHFDVTLYNSGTIEELTSYVIKCGTWRIHVSEADQEDPDRYQD